MNDVCLVFDLDDTLYKEIDFLKSGFRYIARCFSTVTFSADQLYDFMWRLYNNGDNVFEGVCKLLQSDVKVQELLECYRIHEPEISLDSSAKVVLSGMKLKGVRMGIISDGRSITQRNKIKALGLYEYIDKEDVIISEEFGSEKPDEENFRFFEKKYSELDHFIYVGDNPIKDFIAPNRLNWLTIGLKDNGLNIHKSSNVPTGSSPHIWLDGLSELPFRLSLLHPLFPGHKADHDILTKKNQ